MEEGEHGALVLLKPEQEVLSLGVFRAAAAPWPGRSKDRVFREALAQDGHVFGGPGGELDGGERASAFFLGLDGAVHSDEQAEHGFGPRLALNLEEEDELA